MSFSFIAHIDTWAMTASLIAKRHLFVNGSVPADATKRSVEAQEWRQLELLVRRVELLPAARQASLEEMTLHRVDPRGDTGWVRPETAMAYLSLWTNPAAYIFCGTVAQHMPVGSIWIAPPAWPHCAVNWGDTAFYYMSIEVTPKRPEDDEDEEE